MLTEVDLIERLTELERELRELRLSITECEDRRLANQVAQELQVGDLVRILNPTFGETVGRVVKVNRDTEYYTLRGRRFGLRIIRKRKNLQLLEE